MNPITRLLSLLTTRFNAVAKDYSALLPIVEPTTGITKTINQTYYSHSVPQEIAENIENMKRINPQWNYKLYNDDEIEEFISINYGEEILGYYKRIAPEYGAAKADLFRYLLIYKQGGVYIDLKSSITRPLDTLLKPNDGFILSYWDNEEGETHEGVGLNFPEFQHIIRGEYMQWFIISSAGHPLLRSVIIKILENIDKYNPYIDGIGWQGTVGTTGPIPYTLTLEKEQKNNIGTFRWVNLIKDFGIQYSIYEGIDISHHAKVLKKDYRKGIKPVIVHRCKLIHTANVAWLRLMTQRRMKNQTS